MPTTSATPLESPSPLFTDELPALAEAALGDAPSDDAVFREHYRIARAEHCANPDYRFELMCPKAWRCSSLSKAAPTYDAPVCLLARLEAGDANAAFEVVGVMLQREIDAGDWLTCLLESQQERVVAWREETAPEGRVVDCLSEPALAKETGDAPSRAARTRWFARRFGARLFLLRGAASRETTASHDELGRVLHLAQTSFRPLSASRFPLVEHVRTFRPEKPAPVMVLYPESWLLEQPEPGQDTHISVNLSNMRAGTLVGLTTFAVLEPGAAQKAEEVRDLYLTQLGDLPALRPLALGEALDAIAPAAPPVAAHADAGRAGTPVVRTGVTTDAADTLEVRVSVIQLPDCWVLLGTSGPTRWASPPAWMENKRAHALALANLWTPDELRTADELRAADARTDP